MKKIIITAAVAVLLSCGSGLVSVWLGADYETATLAASAAVFAASASAAFAAVFAAAKEQKIPFWKMAVVYLMEGVIIFFFFRWVLPLVAGSGG